MCSKALPAQRTTGRRTTGLAALCLIACSILLLTACGKRGAPMPPLRVTPLQVSDFELRQQGKVLFFEFTYPSTTVSGLALGGIDTVELLELVKPVTGDTSEELPRVDAREFEAAAQSLLTLRGSELNSAVTGDRIQFRLPLAEEGPEEPVASFFAVRTSKGDEVSALSNRVGLVATAPPPAPSGLALEAMANGIQLSWTYPDDAEVEGFEIYRRRAQERGYGEPLARPKGDKREFRDRSATYGERFIYAVRAVKSTNPPVSSGETAEREIEYEDTFAPPLPRNFVALAERGSVRLRWDASRADDVAGYVIYRKEPGRDFHPITDRPIQDLEYLSQGLTAGFSYGFKIQVVDHTGNESELSDPVTTTVR